MACSGFERSCPLARPTINAATIFVAFRPNRVRSQHAMVEESLHWKDIAYRPTGGFEQLAGQGDVDSPINEPKRV
jgi:hypothetical protein